MNNLYGNIKTQKNTSYHYLKQDTLKKYWNNRYLFLLVLPGLIYFLIFRYGPMYGLLMAFQDYSLKLGIFESPWVGLKHFEVLFSGSDFLMVMRNTLIISFYKIIFGFPAPIILALMLNEIKNDPFKRITQTISYLPHFFSWVILGGLVMLVLSPTTGVVNQIIQVFGGDPVYFIAEPRWFRTVLVVSDIWQSIGWGTIIYLAALAGIDPQQYEAAIIDGANRWKRILYVTVPGIAPTVAIMLILRVGSILDVGFDQIMNLLNPSVFDVADIIDTYIYRKGFGGSGLGLSGSGGFQYSFATAAGMFKSVVSLIAILITNHIAKRVSDGEYGIM